MCYVHWTPGMMFPEKWERHLSYIVFLPFVWRSRLGGWGPAVVKIQKRETGESLVRCDSSWTGVKCLKYRCRARERDRSNVEQCCTPSHCYLGGKRHDHHNYPNLNTCGEQGSETGQMLNSAVPRLTVIWVVRHDHHNLKYRCRVRHWDRSNDTILAP